MPVFADRVMLFPMIVPPVWEMAPLLLVMLIAVPVTPVTLPVRFTSFDEARLTEPPEVDPMKLTPMSCEAFSECWNVTTLPMFLPQS
ncbi:MAG: hypothetical protein BWY66_00235 [bacterium ADurb.Bin374]|nr:MAG: hypothetical protein BWY66_00235 [bacterium ADurb.Bin374]